MIARAVHTRPDARRPQIDLGLAISGATLPPGKTRSHSEIAAFAGCSKQLIQKTEKTALKKLRWFLEPELARQLKQYLKR